MVRTASSAITCIIMRAPDMRSPASGWAAGRGWIWVSFIDALFGLKRSRSKKVEGIGERSSLASWGQTCRDPLFCAASLSLSLTNPLMRHIIAILLQNEAGALARVAGLFSTRGYNIESLSVAPT